MPALRSQYTHHIKRGYEPARQTDWLKTCSIKASIREVSINLNWKKWRSFVLWPHGLAGRGCGELETSPAAALLGQGLIGLRG